MNGAKMNITCDFSGADGDAGVLFETVFWISRVPNTKCKGLFSW